MSGRGAISPLRGLLGQLWQSAWIRIGQFPPRRGRCGDTIVGNHALSSVLCVEPQIPISFQASRPDFDFHDQSTPERFLGVVVFCS